MMTEHLSGNQALARLKAMRALMPRDTPPISVYRRPRDRKIIHVSLQLGDMTWYYHRGRVGGSTLILVPTVDYRDVERGTQKFHKEHYPSPYSSVSAELAAATRRAFIPSFHAQLYASNPLLPQLTPKKP